jgi:manganese/zinc-transporting P-type ATPase C
MSQITHPQKLDGGIGERSPAAGSDCGLDVAHELPGRLRVKMPLLRHPHLDLEHFAGLINDSVGVVSVRVRAAAASVIIEYDGTSAARRSVLQKLSAIGLRDLQFRRTASDEGPSIAPVVLPLMGLLSLALIPTPLGRLLTWVVISPRVFRGVHSLITKGITVEVLDAAAVSLGAMLGRYVTALVTDTMMASGDYVEQTTERRSAELLEHLLYPHPHSVWIEREGALVQIPFADVQTGDAVVINTGELVPVDGVVTAGVAQVNQASVTGESVPARKETGHDVIAGSTIESGRITIEARRVGSETTTARIAAFIHESLMAKSETERLAQEFADRRVLVTLGLAAATFLLTGDISRVISVFLIDYSCAVKLNAPVVIRAAMSEGASRGILIKGGQSIEKLSRVDTFVFDKTGTLTRGDLAVTDVIPLAPQLWSQARLVGLAASIEEHSRHPVADAIVRAGRQRGGAHVAHGDVDIIVAHGLRTKVGTETVLIGSRHFLEDHECISLRQHEQIAQALAAQGKMLLYAAAGHSPIGIIALRDELRDDSMETVRRLRQSGVGSLVMLTGDRRERADVLARTVGMDEVFAERQPEEKAEIVKGMGRDGRRVAYLGDGINDAPALATADVGIAMPRGADIARATADILLVNDRVAAVADAHEAALNAMALIRSNFSAAIGINTALFVAASTGWLPPIAAAVLHNGTTLALLGRALSAESFPKLEDDPAAQRLG